ncbi:LysR family transcriptional regulator [Clostridium sp. BJN0013]|uniref:LysR family transcriptional regulator n=1 Tax=Clostridium sp. BJN0013 TaxID=3236840 RepID=UPI0034C6C3F7
MNTQNLKTFLILSKLRNFSLTAEKLFVAQSTVTNRIAELEKEIGKKLFIRDKKHIKLTSEGILFKKYAKRILELEKNAIQEMTQADFYKNTLRIGSTNTIYECHLYPIIHSFLLSSRDTSVKVILDHSQDLLQIGLTPSFWTESNKFFISLKFRPLFEYLLGFLQNKGYKIHVEP